MSFQVFDELFIIVIINFLLKDDYENKVDFIKKFIKKVRFGKQLLN
jgi:hypothetical protein